VAGAREWLRQETPSSGSIPGTGGHLAERGVHAAVLGCTVRNLAGRPGVSCCSSQASTDERR
jgi:hypothetical protein